MHGLWNDVRYALRMLGRQPGFTLVAVLTLALGIGVNTAVFSVTDQVLLRPLPVPNPEELIVLRSPGPVSGWMWSDSDSAASFSYPLYKGLRERGADTAELLARFGATVNVVVDGTAERANGELVTGNYFEALRVRPALGRMFSMEDETSRGANPVVVLSHAYWTRRFGANPNVLNRDLRVNAGVFTIVGVAAPGFAGVQFGRTTDLWVPITMQAQITPNFDNLERWTAYWVAIMGRLRDGLSREQAAERLTVAYRPMLEETLANMNASGWAADRRERFLSKPIELLNGSVGRPVTQSESKTALLLLLGMVGLVLLIACGNVANLMLARGMARQRETAVRLAMGASRGRLVRLLMTENLLLGLAGAAAGLLVATWTLDALAAMLVAQNEGMQTLSTSLDLRVMGFAIALGLLTSVLFGLLPALRASRPDLNATLKDQGAGSGASREHGRVRKALVVAQMAMTLLLLTGAGLFARSFHALTRHDLGVGIQQMVTFSIAPELSGYTPERTRQFLDQLQDAVAALPGVSSASAAVVPMLDNSTSTSNITAEGHTPAEGEDTHIVQNWVAPDFFTTIGVPLLRGRDFTRADGAQAPQVAIVNESMAKQFHKGDALGRRFAFGSGSGVQLNITVVGVVPDMNHTSVREKPRPMAFLPAAQLNVLGSFTAYVRTSSPLETVIAGVRREVQRLDAGLPIYNVRTMEEQVGRLLTSERFLALLSSSFGLLASALAALGIGGVMTYMVVRRTREIGIRMAIGAGTRDVYWLILREVAMMTALGVAVGLPLAIFLARFTESLLFGVKPVDPLILTGTVVFLAGVALLAGYVPARRAARVDPVVALRYE